MLLDKQTSWREIEKDLLKYNKEVKNDNQKKRSKRQEQIVLKGARDMLLILIKLVHLRDQDQTNQET